MVPAAQAVATLGVMAETIPILPSADFDATTRFWAALGFGARGRWPVACYVRFATPDEARDVHAG